MLDVEYLLAHPSVSGAVIYEYRTGALRRPVREALTAMAQREDRIVRTCEPGELLANLVEGSVFEPRQLELCDWVSANILKVSEGDLDEILHAFAARADQRIVLFVPMGCPLTMRPLWSCVRKASFVLEEAPVTRETLQPVLRYLEASTDLADRPDLLTQDGFVSHFEDMLPDGPDLFTFIKAFDDVVLTATDPRTNVYDQTHYRRATRKRSSRTSTKAHLQVLLTEKDSWDAVRLVAALDTRRWRRGWSARAIVGELYGLTTRLLEDGRNGLDAQVGDRVLWTAMLLATEDDLVSGGSRTARRSQVVADGLMPELDRLARAFICRSSIEHADRLTGLWRSLDRTLGRVAKADADPLGGPREALVRSFGEVLPRVSGQARSPWLQRLARRVAATMEGADAARDVSTEAETYAERQQNAVQPATFDEILGHGHVVEALRERVRRADHRTALLLYGLKGVGKRTLARLYAKAVLCETPTLRGMSCNTCAACQEFDCTGGFGYGYADLRREDARDRAHDLVKIARTATFSKRVVLVIANVDECGSDTFDVLLKTLEEPPPGVTLVLMGGELHKMRLAGVSRCRVYRMRSVPMPEAIVYVRDLLQTHGTSCDEQAVTVLAAAAKGRPGSLQALTNRVAHLPVLTLMAVRAELDLDWVAPIGGWLRAAWEGGPLPAIPAPMDKRKVSDEILRRIWVVLLHMRLLGVAGYNSDGFWADPALMHGKECDIEELVAQTEEQVAARGVDAQGLWQSLARHWLSTDHSDIEGLRIAGQAARRLVIGAT